MRELMRKIAAKIKKEPEVYQAYEDLYKVACGELEKDKTESVRYLKWLAEQCGTVVPVLIRKDMDAARRFMGLHKRVLHAAAVDDFDSFLQFVEWERDPEKKFYLPRRHVLKVVVDDLQDLADGNIDFLGVSLPSRVGKSTLCIFFMTWIMGKRPDVANVMSGHSDKLTDGFYREILSILNDKEEYLWHEVFPGLQIVETSAKNETIDLEKKKRFPTMTCRSVSGTLTGAVEIGTGGILYCDDLIEDLQESLNPLRLQAKYDAYLNQLKDRKKQGARELMVGTRWNVSDPLGRIREQYADNPRYRFRVIPALNEDNESNFVYAYGKGFDTAYYLDMKDSIDDATWCAKYMGSPYIREGLLFPEDELLTYNGVLPDGEPTVIAVCDVAWGGGDSLAMPFAYVYGDEVYIHDVIFNKGDKEVTRPVVIGRTLQHKPYKVRFEANNGGHEYADIVDAGLREKGFHTNITAKKAPSSNKSIRGMGKVARIIQFSPDIKKFYFLADKYRSREYRAFMREVTTFVQTGNNLHDDACDSLAMLADELAHGRVKYEVIDRLW